MQLWPAPGNGMKDAGCLTLIPILTRDATKCSCSMTKPLHTSSLSTLPVAETTLNILNTKVFGERSLRIVAECKGRLSIGMARPAGDGEAPKKGKNQIIGMSDLQNQLSKKEFLKVADARRHM